MKEKLVNYLKSGVPLIAINSIEITRCTEEVVNTISEWNKKVGETNASEYLKVHGYDIMLWDINTGWNMVEVGATREEGKAPQTASQDLREFMAPRNCLKYPSKDKKSPVCIYMLQNFNLLWKDNILLPIIIADCIDIAKKRIPHKHIIFIGSIDNIPIEIAPLFGWIDHALPSREELKAISTKYDKILEKKLTNENKDAIADSAAGLTLYEADQAIRSSIVFTKGKSVDTKYIFAEKAKSVKKSGLLDYMEIEETIQSVGGLSNLKKWVQKVAHIFKNPSKALEYGLPIPRGTLLCGISGTGKSLIAKVIATEFGVPLYRWDLGKLFGSLVGTTEKNTREAFKLMTSVAPAVFYIDEIEKSLAGAESSSYTDSGVTARVVGAFLTFMQEKTAPVFFAATANSVDRLSPELLRRFNGIWFVDLPTDDERDEIFRIHISKTGRKPDKFKLETLVKETDMYTGAEIELAVEEGMQIGFAEGREYNTKDIVTAIRNMPRLADTKSLEIRRLRAWSKGRARVANVEEGFKPTWWNDVDNLILDKNVDFPITPESSLKK